MLVLLSWAVGFSRSEIMMLLYRKEDKNALLLSIFASVDKNKKLKAFLKIETSFIF